MIEVVLRGKEFDFNSHRVFYYSHRHRLAEVLPDGDEQVIFVPVFARDGLLHSIDTHRQCDLPNGDYYTIKRDNFQDIGTFFGAVISGKSCEGYKRSNFLLLDEFLNKGFETGITLLWTPQNLYRVATYFDADTKLWKTSTPMVCTRESTIRASDRWLNPNPINDYYSLADFLSCPSQRIVYVANGNEYTMVMHHFLANLPLEELL